MSNTIIHVSEVNISPESGMGRIEYYWKQAFEDSGYNFVHIGPKEVGTLAHPALFPVKALRYYKHLKIKPGAFIVHEPSSGYFVNQGIPCFVESHGIERRYWEAQLMGLVPPADGNAISLKTRLSFPIWRLWACDKGLKNATALLLSNAEDREFAEKHYHRLEKNILIFKNGVNEVSLFNATAKNDVFTVLFNASWLARKGIYTLIKAAQLLHDQGLTINYLLIGTGLGEESVLKDWPEQLRPFIQVVNHFSQEDESSFLATSSIFVLPSYFEGQSLSLLQAMAAGKCCITTNCCGQKDVIENGTTGLLFEPGDYNELARLVSVCYSNIELTKNIGSNAKKAVAERSWELASKEVMAFVLKNM